MLERLLGLETEFVLRFSPTGGRTRPGNEQIYRAWMTAIGRRVHTRSAWRGFGHDRRFTENGGAFCYEALPWAFQGGLLEGATPECRGPGQALLYQRAQEALLAQVRTDAEAELARVGHPGRLALLKNGRDAEGHVYGPQENYEAVVARGPMLALWRAGLVVLLPSVAVGAALTWLLSLLVLSVLLLVTLLRVMAVTLLPWTRLARRWRGLLGEDVPLPPWFGRMVLGFQQLCLGPALLGFSLLVRATAFRPQRRALLGFLASRPVVTGAGTLDADGLFTLSEKATSLRRTMRWTVLPSDRCIFDIGNLMKDFLAPMIPRPSAYLRLFRRRQRLQIGSSDATVAQVAEYLKVGTTALVLDLAEAGLLRDAPRPSDPVRALARLASDPELKLQIPVRGGGRLGAVALQRWYQRRAREWVAGHAAPDLEAAAVVRLWGEVLDDLESDPDRLIGRLDWVTKRWLLAEHATAPRTVRKKIDLRYHELGDGYLAWLEEAGLAPRLVTPEAVERAVREPPWGTPARARGRAVASAALASREVWVGWDRIRIGGVGQGEVIRLDDHRPH